MRLLSTTLPRPFTPTTARIVLAEPLPELQVPKPESQRLVLHDQAELLSTILDETGLIAANIFQS
jgi:hypothetical protein